MNTEDAIKDWRTTFVRIAEGDFTGKDFDDWFGNKAPIGDKQSDARSPKNFQALVKISFGEMLSEYAKRKF